MDELDVVVLGTGLAESITAAALSKAGFSIAHIDANPYYGGDDASLTVDELVTWADARATPSSEGEDTESGYLRAQRKRFTSISHSGAVPPRSRQYSISLSPTLVPSIGPLIDSLIASGVSRYGGFKLLERVALYDSPGKVRAVPSSKEDVFKDKTISLIEKRRLMRFLMFAAGEFEGKPELEGAEATPFTTFLHDKFSLNDDAVSAIAYALAFCTSTTDPTLPALQRIRRYLRSSGRYGPSPFLVGHYGGAGELAQGFCRTSAVGGAVYILGRDVQELSRNPKSEASPREYTLKLADFEDHLSADLLVASPDYLSPELSASASSSLTSHSVVRCVAIIDKPLSFSGSGSTHEATEGEKEDAEASAEPTATERKSSEDSDVNGEVDTALLVFPPSSVPGASDSIAANVLITGEGSMSTPRGTWILYITMPDPDAAQSAETVLRPYLDATLTLTTSPAAPPLFTLFYRENVTRPAPPVVSDTTPSTLIFSSSYAPYLTEVADSAASSAEAMFWDAVKALTATKRFPKATAEGENKREETAKNGPESFWPPLDYVEDDSEEW